MSDIRHFLRGLPVFAGDLPDLDPSSAPLQPEVLFVAWLTAAVDAGVREPHAMTLSTVGVDGDPSARTLLLKNVDELGWQFAGHAASPKGQELVRHPSAALTFYWAALARQVRVRGPVTAEPADRSAADFLARPPGSRAEASIGRQSQPFGDRHDFDLVTEQARQRIEDNPGLIVAEWTLYNLHATQVEFWQGDKQRRHTRLRYTRQTNGWKHAALWP
jgi:pyridoxamine 5'-phosphate oxidase